MVDATLAELQSGHHLRVVVDNQQAADYLQNISGVKAVETCDQVESRACFSLDAGADAAPDVVAAIQQAGDKLYTLQPEVRNLETVFANANANATIDDNRGVSNG